MFHENLLLDKKTVPENVGDIVGQWPGIWYTLILMILYKIGIDRDIDRYR